MLFDMQVSAIHNRTLQDQTLKRKQDTWNVKTTCGIKTKTKTTSWWPLRDDWTRKSFQTDDDRCIGTLAAVANCENEATSYQFWRELHKFRFWSYSCHFVMSHRWHQSCSKSNHQISNQIKIIWFDLKKNQIKSFAIDLIWSESQIKSLKSQIKSNQII